jgi:hypothetical protein
LIAITMVTLSVALTSSSVVAAQPAEAIAEAKQLFKASARAYQVGNFAAAVKALDQAYELAPRPELRFSAAQALRALYADKRQATDLRKAAAYYLQYLAEVKEGGRRTDAAEALTAVQDELRRLDRDTSPPSVESPAPTVPTEPSVVATTTLMVDSPVDIALVSLDGQAPEPVPLIREVAPGDHHLIVRAAGYEPVDRKVLVPQGKMKSIDLPLEELPATIAIRAEPGAMVVVDGRTEGATPLAAPIHVGSGEHRVRVGMSGRKPYSRDLRVGRGEVVPLDVELEWTAQRKGSWVLLGLGTASALAGGAFVVASALNAEQARSIERRREDESRPLTRDEADEHNAALDRRDDYAWAGGIALGAAGLELAVGLLLFGLDSPDLYAQEGTETDAQVSPVVGLDARTGAVAVRLGPAPPGSLGIGVRLCAP